MFYKFLLKIKGDFFLPNLLVDAPLLYLSFYLNSYIFSLSLLLEDLDLESGTYNNFLKINANGSHLYPGLILPNSKVGLEDISAVRATVDHTEVGELNSNIRSLIAFNTDSEVISTFRYNVCKSTVC